MVPLRLAKLVRTLAKVHQREQPAIAESTDKANQLKAWLRFLPAAIPARRLARTTAGPRIHSVESAGDKVLASRAAADRDTGASALERPQRRHCCSHELR